MRALRETDCRIYGSAELFAKAMFGIRELEHDDDETPRGHRERHVRNGSTAKARNHSWVA